MKKVVLALLLSCNLHLAHPADIVDLIRTNDLVGLKSLYDRNPDTFHLFLDQEAMYLPSKHLQGISLKPVGFGLLYGRKQAVLFLLSIGGRLLPGDLEMAIAKNDPEFARVVATFNSRETLTRALGGRTNAEVLKQVCTVLPRLPFHREHLWYKTLAQAMAHSNKDLIRFLLRANKFLANARIGIGTGTVGQPTLMQLAYQNGDPAIIAEFKAAGGKISLKERATHFALSKKGATLAATGIAVGLVGKIYRGRKERNEEIQRAHDQGEVLKKLKAGKF